MANSTSHGGHNAIVPGAFGNGYAEHQVVRTIDSKVRAITGALNATDDIGGTVNANLVNIVNKMNQRPTDFHLSHHLNAFNGQAHGVEVWYYAGDTQAGLMAVRISQAIANALGITNRGAKATTSLYVISQSRGRALLIEWCFIDNANDMAKFMPNMDKAIAAALACLGYGSSSAPTPTNPVTSPSNNSPNTSTSGKSLEQMAGEVQAGAYGNGDTRRNKLGKYFTSVQAIVDHRYDGNASKAVNTLANETMKGTLGNGDERKRLLGSYYAPVQAEVNRR